MCSKDSGQHILSQKIPFIIYVIFGWLPVDYVTRPTLLENQKMRVVKDTVFSNDGIKKLEWC